MDPVSNVFVKTFLTRTATTSGLAGAALGVALGLLLAWLLRRRQHRASKPPGAAA
jgi:hypothetical protein